MVVIWQCLLASGTLLPVGASVAMFRYHLEICGLLLWKTPDLVLANALERAHGWCAFLVHTSHGPSPATPAGVYRGRSGRAKLCPHHALFPHPPRSPLLTKSMLRFIPDKPSPYLSTDLRARLATALVLCEKLRPNAHRILLSYLPPFCEHRGSIYYAVVSYCHCFVSVDFPSEKQVQNNATSVVNNGRLAAIVRSARLRCPPTGGWVLLRRAK